MKRQALVLSLLAVGTFMAVAANRAFTEDKQDKSPKGGEYHLATGQTYNIQANDHARLLEKYATGKKEVPADVVREHAAAIRQSSEAALKAYDRLAKSDADNAELMKRLELLQKRLEKVNSLTKKLESQVAKNSAAEKAVITQTKEISQELRANHNDIRAIDKSFYNSASSNYYETGEGHFVD